MNIDCKNETYFLADKIIQLVLETMKKPTHLSENQEESSKELEKLYSEFEQTLNEEQKNCIFKLDSANNAVESSNKVYWMLYGMKLYKRMHEVLNEMAENPANIVKYYDDKVKNTP